MSLNTLNTTDFYRKLEEVLDLAPGTLKGGEALSGLDGWDSLAVLGLIAMADKNYGVTIAPTRIPDCRTVDDLAGLILGDSKVAAPHGQPA